MRAVFNRKRVLAYTVNANAVRRPTTAHTSSFGCPIYAAELAGSSVTMRLDGTVDSIRFRPDTNDYEIHLMSSPTSPFLVIVDHLTDLLVFEGDTVAAGQPLAKSARSL